MRVAAVQHDIVWEDAAATCRHLAPLVAEAADAGARLVVLSEMFATGFTMASHRVAEAPDGPTTQFLLDTAASHDCWVGGTIALRGDELPTNSFVLAAPDGTVHRYDKRHPFTFANEHEAYRGGTDPCTVTIDGVRCSLFVCYDLRFADDFWVLAEQTDCYLVPANWPSSRRTHWETLLRARAIENQAYVVGVNRVGTAGGLQYGGDSAVIDPFGEILAEGPGPADGSPGREQVLVAEVDPARVAEVRERFPFLRDRRPPT